jgi:hypothetical protein
MFISPYMTSVTRQHIDGKQLRDCQPDMTRRSGPGNSKRYRKRSAD